MRKVAIVTGASSGIGEALAVAMAAQGTHVVLVARSVDRLTALAARIEGAGGKATVLPVDLAAAGAAQRLFDEVQRRDLPVDTLLNNAGFGFYGPFESEAPSHLSEMLQVNVVALTELTRLFVPVLLERRGTILNIASTVAFQPSPYMSAYGATKAFVLSLSEALWAEYRGRGLHVAAVCPGPVETPFIDAMGAGVRSTAVFKMALPVDDVVRTCLRALDGKRPTRIVGLVNWLLAQTSRFSPRALTARVSAAMFAPRGRRVYTCRSRGDRMRGNLIALLMLVFVPVAACGDAAPAKVVAGHDTADTVPGSASSACAVFVDHCVRCHDGILVSPDLRPGTQASLVGASSGYPGNILVVAGDPDASFLFRKMAGTQGGSEGTAMPPTERVAGTELEVVRGWIAAGAADDCDGTERAP